jgi:hypothetical protein
MMTREAAVSHGLVSAEFLGLSPEELLAKCREYRAEAERLAAGTSSDMRRGYVHLVTQWSLLADEIQSGIERRRSVAREHESGATGYGPDIMTDPKRATASA